MATVTVSELMCGVTYNITAEGTLNGDLVGPRSSLGNITTAPCASASIQSGKNNFISCILLYIAKLCL